MRPRLINLEVDREGLHSLVINCASAEIVVDGNPNGCTLKVRDRKTGGPVIGCPIQSFEIRDHREQESA